jgi:peptidoglycan/xylan/chitin deacetylase (PgdA/CDA1 family)
MYHSIDSSGSVLSVTPTDFAFQIACLSARGFRGISLAKAIEHREQHRSWPERSVVLTFDDGFANFFHSAVPELRRHDFTATLFIVTGHMGGFNNWPDQPVGLNSIPLISWQQATDLLTIGIEIGSHTQTHRDLRNCTAAEIEREMVQSRSDIAEHLGIVPQSFAYPYGGVNRVAEQIALRSYKAAVTTELKHANGHPLSLLPRIDMYYLRDRRRFENLLDGNLKGYLTLRRWGRQARRMFVSDSGKQTRELGSDHLNVDLAKNDEIL